MQCFSSGRLLRIATAAVSILILIALVFPSLAFAQQGDEFTITITTTETVDAAGNAHVQGVMTFNPARGYDRVKRVYPNLYVLFRDFGPERSSFEMDRDTLKITSDDGQRTINFSADLMGASVSRKNRWQITLAPNEQVTSQDANKISTLAQPTGESATKLLGITNYVLPARAQSVQVDKTAHLLTYTLPLPRASQPSSASNTIKKKGLVEALKTGGLSSDELADQISQRGVNFKMTSEDEQELKNAGASPVVLQAVRKHYRGTGSQVDVNVRYKQRLMAAVYKVYGDSEARDGAYWVAKTVFKNSGAAPISDLKIYYRLGEFSDMSVPEAYSVVAPGGTVVDTYYPVIKSRVTELKTTTPLQLYIKYEYKDGTGKYASEELTKRVEMLGINQFEFSNLSDEDRTDSWFDYFNNAPLLSAFVTRLDDPVKQFAGYVSNAAGGVAAASDNKSALTWLEAAYSMELLNDIVYSTPSGFLTKDHSSGQDIKYPRDVFRDKSGTCVDLAITYAALAEAVGLKANLMVVPGHTFAVIRLPGGEYLPVENTGLGGGNQRMTFEQAVEAGKKELQKYVEDGVFYFVNVEDQWSNQRIPNPELQQLTADFLEKSGIKPLSELSNNNNGGRNSSRGGGVKSAGGSALGTPYRVVHDHAMGMLSAFCVGTLYVSADTVTFVADKATDGRMDRFQIKKSEIKEAKKNKLPLGQNGNYLQAFHIRMTNGVNYNFAVVDNNGRSLAPDNLLMQLMQ